MIEAKHLIPYLPYSLKVVMEGKKCNVAWMSTKNIAVHRPGGIGDYKKIAWKYAHLNIRPILKPLSRLRDFSPAIWKYGMIENELLPMVKLTYNEINVLFENHFDVFGLIEQGLAVEEKI